jgi:hypothetical protein
MGMTNRACPLREKSGERFHAQNIRWGCAPKVPAPRINYIGISLGRVLREVPILSANADIAPAAIKLRNTPNSMIA